jgi:serine/threonine protein phosphatase 1
MSTFVIGDIHNRYQALEQCIERSHIDKQKDTLISLGDICDGPQTGTDKVINTLLGFKNLIICAGNHDGEWFKNYLKTGVELPIWVHQGGYYTLLSYDSKRENIPQSHINLINNELPYYIDELNNLYVHGGFDERYPIETQDPIEIMWNRELACSYGSNGQQKAPITTYNRIFLGHTSSQFITCNDANDRPIITNNVIMVDTGAGWIGKLTIMNVETLEYWQSDIQVV